MLSWDLLMKRNGDIEAVITGCITANGVYHKHCLHGGVICTICGDTVTSMNGWLSLEIRL